MNPLDAISPVDGRYHDMCSTIRDLTSERALMDKRVRIEIEYLKALCEELKIPFEDDIDLSIDFNAIKDIEAYTHHDVKAVELWLVSQIKNPALKPLIHFGLTSQDINHSVLPMMMANLRDLFVLILEEINKHLSSLAEASIHAAMLAHTHGQPATPTTFGKELFVYVTRLRRQIDCLTRLKFAVKLGGASGTLAAHYAAYPDVDWTDFMNQFAETRLQRPRNPLTTQINHYDEIAEFLHVLSRVGSIVRDICQDMWLYISKGYVVNKSVRGEVGSSTMPHKTNPIHFENAEGNVKVSQALLDALARELPVSRLQRDLCDSTMSRNIGVAASHLWIALTSMRRGFSRMQIDRQVMRDELMSHWEILSEMVQTVLRREGRADAYDMCKEATRGNGKWDRAKYSEFVSSLRDVSSEIKSELLEWSPDKYLGFIENNGHCTASP